MLIQAKAALAANFADLSTAIEWLLAGNGNDGSASTTAATGPRRRRKKGTQGWGIIMLLAMIITIIGI